MSVPWVIVLVVLAIKAGWHIGYWIVLADLERTAAVRLRQANWRRRAYVARGGEHLLDQISRLDHEREALLAAARRIRGEERSCDKTTTT